jgi:hypothetical protein
VCPPVRLEDAFPFVYRHSRPIVPDFGLHQLSNSLSTDSSLPSAEAVGVGDQVAENLAKPDRVGSNRDFSRGVNDRIVPAEFAHDMFEILGRAGHLGNMISRVIVTANAVIPAANAANPMS